MNPPIRIGIATPMANPTVEPELRALFPPEVNMLVTRSVAQGDSRTRLVAYFDRIAEALDSFGGMPLHAFGFACTASSYLLEAGREARRCEALSAAYGYPVITASGAIEQALRDRGFARLAIASPYPAWIAEACTAFWRNRGFDVVASTTAASAMDDTRAIYSLDAEAAGAAFAEALAGVSADAVLITGTGLPTRHLLAPLERQLGMPVLSSNTCLVEACLKACAADRRSD